MRLMTVAGAALLAAMTFSADAEAVECFTVTSEDFDSDWSLIVASRCPYAAY